MFQTLKKKRFSENHIRGFIMQNVKALYVEQYG